MESVICDLCQSDQSEAVTRQRDLLLEVTNDEFTIVRCCHCGLVYLNPRPSKDLLGSFYPTVYYPPVQAKARPQFQQQAKKVFCTDQAMGVGRLLWIPLDCFRWMVAHRAAYSVMA